MEPYAMNGFWTKHGGMNSRGIVTPLQHRAPGHKNCMRRMCKNLQAIENLETCLEAEKKWMRLANEGTTVTVVSAIDDDVVRRGSGAHQKVEQDAKKTDADLTALASLAKASTDVLDSGKKRNQDTAAAVALPSAKRFKVEVAPPRVDDAVKITAANDGIRGPSALKVNLEFDITSLNRSDNERGVSKGTM